MSIGMATKGAKVVVKLLSHRRHTLARSITYLGVSLTKRKKIKLAFSIAFFIFYPINWGILVCIS